jgi:superfamily I DNA/RNA helicase
MEWTRNRTFEINPSTGAIQIVDTERAERPSSVSEPTKEHAGLFPAVSDEVLIGFGVPAVLIPSVRALNSIKELDDIQKHLPAEAAEALWWLAEGIPVPEIELAIDRQTRTTATIDTQDFGTALNHPDSRRRFVVIDSDRDLNAVLDGPLAKWRIFLHPSQARIVSRMFSGPACVIGSAGTGKTVVAMHRTKFLLQNIFTAADDRVLFTTFTANLARDTRTNLQNLCGDEIKRVDVVHLDSWSASYLSARGCTFDVATGEEISHFWAEAASSIDSLRFSTNFLRQEWEQVIQARDLTTKEEYLESPRTGRGVLISQADRTRVWEACAVFRTLLASAGKSEHSDIIRQARQHLEANCASYPYRAVVVDEVQDLSPQKLRLLRAMVAKGPNDLFVVGDPSQRIYGQKVSLSSCGISVRGRSSKLKVNYRTTEQIRSWAVRLLERVPIEDMDGDGDSLLGYRSLLSGPSPEVRLFKTLREEQDFLITSIKDALKDRNAEEICLVTRTSHTLRRCYLPALEENGVPCAIADKATDLPRDKIRLATMHRVKGLEYPFMILAGTNETSGADFREETLFDAQAQVNHDAQERSLLFVAATRARDRLLVTGFGKASPYLS